MAFPAFGYSPQTSQPTYTPTIDSPDSGIKNQTAPQAAPDSIRNSFLPPNITSVYTNASNALGNLGSYAGSMIPQSANFINQTMNPFLNNFEQMFLGAGQGNAMRQMEAAMSRVDDQFENNPFHSARNRMQGEVMNQFARDSMSQAGQMGMQRQALGLQASQLPWQAASSAIDQNVGIMERLVNLGNNQYNNPFTIAYPYWTGAQYAAPQTLVTQGGSK